MSEYDSTNEPADTEHDSLERIRHYERELERIRAIVAATNTTHDLDEILQIVRSAVREVSEVDRVGIWLARDEILYGTWGTDAEGQLRDERGEATPYVKLRSDLREALLGNTPWILLSGSAKRLSKSKSREPVPRELLAIPLRSHHQTIGVLYCDNLLTDRPLTGVEMPPLLSLCEMAACVIYHARALQEKEEAGKRQRNLLEAAVFINASTRLEEITRRVRDAAISVAGFDRAGVFLVDENRIRGFWGTDRKGNIRDERYDVRPRSDWANLVEPLAEGRCRVLVDEAPLDDLADDVYQTYQNATIGLITERTLVGLLFVDNMLSQRPLLRGDIEELLPFTEQAALAIRNACLLEERTRQVIRLQRLSHLAVALGAEADLGTVCRRVRDGVVEYAGFDRAAVLLLDQDQEILRGTWGTNRELRAEDISHVEFSLKPGHDNPYCRVGRGEVEYVLYTDFTVQRNVPVGDTMYGVRGFAVLPMRAGREILGVLCVDNLTNEQHITNEDAEGLISFASQAATIIQNLRLRRELERLQTALTHKGKSPDTGKQGKSF